MIPHTNAQDGKRRLSSMRQRTLAEGDSTFTPSAAPDARPTPPTLSPTTSTPSQSPSALYSRPEIVAYSGPSVDVSNLSLTVAFFNANGPLFQEFNAMAQVLTASGNVSTQIFALANCSDKPFAYMESFTATNNSILPATPTPPLMSIPQLPFGLFLNDDTGAIYGQPQEVMDLSTVPLTCISFPQSAPPPQDYEAWLLENNTLFVRAYGRQGFVDQETGQMIGFFSNPNVTSNWPANETDFGPYFCAVFWLGINTFSSPAYQAGIVSVAFHSVRNSGKPYMTYADNSAFSSYEVYLFLGAIPFWALTLACLLLYPSYVCIKACCRRMNFLERCRARALGCCCRKRPISPESDKAALLSHRAGTSVRFLSDDENSQSLAQKPKRTKKKKKKQHKQTLVPLAASGKGFSARRLLATATGKAQEQSPSSPPVSSSSSDEDDDGDEDEGREAVRKYHAKIDRILTSPHVSRRFCFLFVATFAAFCLSALVVGLTISFTDSAEEYNKANDAMTAAHDLSVVALLQVNVTMGRIINNASLSQPYRQAILSELRLEQDRLARLVSLVDPRNLRVSDELLTNLKISEDVQTIIEIFAFIIQLFGPFFILVSLLLASCTCRWGDLILFENVSICVGLTLKGWLILCATLSWFCVMFFFWNCAVIADICYMPSVLYVPDISDASQSLMTQPAPYDPNDNNYYFPPYEAPINNLANFYWQCHYASPSFENLALSPSSSVFGQYAFNPLMVFTLQAWELNALAQTLAQSEGDGDTLAVLNNVERLLKRTLDPVACSQFGAHLTRGTELLCGPSIIGNFLTFFFLCTLGVTYMIVIPCTDWIAPNLYRQWQANRVYEGASKETEKLIKLASRISSRSTESKAAATAAAATATSTGDISTLKGGGGHSGSSGFTTPFARLRSQIRSTKLSRARSPSATTIPTPTNKASLSEGNLHQLKPHDYSSDMGGPTPAYGSSSSGGTDHVARTNPLRVSGQSDLLRASTPATVIEEEDLAVA